MKKVISLVLILTVLLSLNGCGKSHSEELKIVPDSRAAELTQKGMGYHADIVNQDGVIVGMQYYSTPQEIAMTAQYGEDSITVQITLNFPDRVPFSEMGALKIENYEIVDESGTVSDWENTAEAAEIVNGTAAVKITLSDGLKDGNYILKIDSILSEKKGEQPLEIFGKWNVALTK